nr:hypothetical protein [Neobacillus sp. Marseille-Q6967]
MRKKIKIKTANLRDKRLMLCANEVIKGLSAKEQILVDSANFSFIYLMENQDDYTYIEIPEDIWGQLKIALDNKTAIFIHDDHDQIELTNFHEELEYVISNIEGNSNYGEEMVKKVENIFKD